MPGASSKYITTREKKTYIILFISMIVTSDGSTANLTNYTSCNVAYSDNFFKLFCFFLLHVFAEHKPGIIYCTVAGSPWVILDVACNFTSKKRSRMQPGLTERLQGTDTFFESPSSLFLCLVTLVQKVFCLAGSMKVLGFGFCYCFLINLPHFRYEYIGGSICPYSYETFFKELVLKNLSKRGKMVLRGVL